MQTIEHGAPAQGAVTTRRLGKSARRLWVFLHVAFSSGWVGLSLAMSALSIAGMYDAGLAAGAYRLMHVLDLVLVIPLVLASITSGVVLSLGTHWGLFRHWWIVLKLTISVAIVAVAAAWESFLVRALAGDLSALTAVQAHERAQSLAVCMVCFSTLLGIATWLSTYKPQALTPWTQGKPRRV